MAYVDLGELNYVTLSPGWVCTAWNTAGSDFRPGQWYRAAPWLDSDNSPGTTIVIGDSGTAFGRSGESVSIDGNGNVIVLLTTKNVGKGTAAIGMQWLSAPEIGE
jgi:hypothetical protein